MKKHKIVLKTVTAIASSDKLSNEQKIKALSVLEERLDGAVISSSLPPDNVIAGYICWNDTPEGHTFWAAIDRAISAG